MEAVVVAGAFMPLAARQEVGFQRGFQAAHGIQALRLIRGREFHHLRPLFCQQRHQVDLELRLHQVLAGLAREHDHDREPLVFQYGTHNRVGGCLLVSAQPDAAEDAREVAHLAQGAQKVRTAQFLSFREPYPLAVAKVSPGES